MRKRIALFCDKIIFSGIIGLVVFTPLAIGSVHVWAFSVMELVVIGLVLTWMTKLLCLRDDLVDESLSDSEDLVCKMPKNRYGFIKTPLNLPFLIFVCIVFFQIVPLPMSAIKFLSPKTYEIYSNSLSDKEDHAKAHLSTLNQKTIDKIHPSYPLFLEGRKNEAEERLKDDEVKSLSRFTSLPHDFFTLSINPHSTRIELFKILSYVAVFFLIVNNFKTRREINYLILAIILVGSFEAVYGFYEYSSGNKNILFMLRKYESDRLTGTYVNANHLAGLLEMVIPIAIAFSICRKKGFIKNNSPEHIFTTKGLPFRTKLSLFFNKNNFINILLFISLGLLVGALFLSQSRMGVMGFLISILIFGIYFLKRFYRGYGLVFAVGGLFGVLFFASWLGLNPLYKRFSAVDELTINARMDIWKDTGGILRDFPIIGTGKGTFVDIYRQYKTIPNDLTYDHAHNDYFELLSEMGLLGLVVVAIGGAFFTYKIINQLTKRQNDYVIKISVGLFCSIAAIVVHSVTDFNMSITANALLLSIILALLTLTAHLGKSRKPKARSGDRKSKASHGNLRLTKSHTSPLSKNQSYLRKVLYTLIIPITIFLSIPVLKTYMADMYYKRAKALEESSHTNIPLSISYMQKCISLDKTNSAYRFDLGKMFLQLTKEQSSHNKEFERNAKLAAEQFENAIILNPCHYLAYSALGIVCNIYRTTTQTDKLTSQQTDKPTSGIDKLIATERSYLNKAIALNPSSSSNNYTAGYAYLMDWNTLRQEDRERTSKYLRTSIEHNPTYFNKVLQTSWRYIQDYNWIKRIIPDTPDSYMRAAKFFDEKRIFTERNIAWEEAQIRNGKPFLPSIFEDNNLIVNGSFEYEPGSAWNDWIVSSVDGADVSLDNSEAVEGNNSLRILFDGTKDVTFYNVVQTRKVESGTTYLLTGYIKTQDITSKSGIKIHLSCKNLQKITEPFLGTRNWEKFTLEFEAPEDCDHVNVAVYRRGLDTVLKELISGIVWIDRLQLSPTSTLSKN